MTDETRVEATDRAMDALAANAEQDRLIVNPTDDCDSIAEHAERLARLTQGEAHAHACEIIRLAARLRSSNAVECENERAIPALLDTTRWGVKSAANAIRPALKPGEDQHLADLLDVIPVDVLMVQGDLRPAFVHELHVGVAKRTRLLEAISARVSS